LLIIFFQLDTPKTRATIGTTLVTALTALFLLFLSHLEHLRSIRPSTILNVFLSFTLLFDLARLRTLYFMSNQAMTSLFALSCAIKAILLVFEATEKKKLLKKAYENSPIESTSGVINRALFWWLRDLLWRGSKTTLTVDSLPSLDDDLKNASTSQSLFDKWDNGELRDSKDIQKRITNN
jgi:hypothetical protein